MKKIHVQSQDAGERLDRFLVRCFADVSRSRIQKMIINGQVTVNGKTVSKHYFLEEGEEIEIREGVPEKKETKKETESDSVLDAVVVPTLSLLYDDPSICVVEKPVGIIVHPVPGRNHGTTLVDLLVQKFPEMAGVGDDPQRPGIVQRLDKDVSGVMVVAKTPEAFVALKEQFQKREVYKEYRAIVHGVPSQEAGVIKFAIARSKTQGGKMAARPEHEEGRDAWTEYDLLSTRDQRYAELSVRIKTGRTHQIRAHLAAIDHPVVGDVLYTSKRYAKRTYPRLFLHSHILSFRHPENGQEMRIESAIPPEFGQLTQT
jgi:23S rRNA pseudouridine1911/1915/1917 synthase